jgi:hypothetical protein
MAAPWVMHPRTVRDESVPPSPATAGTGLITLHEARRFAAGA